MYIYIYIYFGYERFQDSLFSFENESDSETIYLTSLISKTSFYCWLFPNRSSIVKLGLQMKPLDIQRYFKFLF